MVVAGAMWAVSVSVLDEWREEPLGRRDVYSVGGDPVGVAVDEEEDIVLVAFPGVGYILRKSLDSIYLDPVNSAFFHRAPIAERRNYRGLDERYIWMIDSQIDHERGGQDILKGNSSRPSQYVGFIQTHNVTRQTSTQEKGREHDVLIRTCRIGSWECEEDVQSSWVASRCRSQVHHPPSGSVGPLTVTVVHW